MPEPGKAEWAWPMWTVAEAKSRFSELIDRTNREGPQMISKHGQKVAVVVSIDEWERKSRRSGSLAQFLAESPLRDSGIEVSRMEGGLRDVEL